MKSTDEASSSPVATEQGAAEKLRQSANQQHCNRRCDRGPVDRRGSSVRREKGSLRDAQEHLVNEDPDHRQDEPGHGKRW
jgi:hypothetical protein